MKDHFNDIHFYTTLTVHVVSNNFDGHLRQNSSPCGTFLALKDHLNKIYTTLTVHIVSINFEDLLRQSASPFGTKR